MPSHHLEPVPGPPEQFRSEDLERQLRATHRIPPAAAGAAAPVIPDDPGTTSRARPPGTPPRPSALVHVDAAWRAWGDDGGAAAAAERFAVMELVGEGSSGDVFAARDQGFARSVALKVLKPHLAGDPAALRDFLAEARMTAALQHPNVLPVHDLGTTVDGRPFFSMDLNREGTLGDAVQGSTPASRDPRIASASDVVTIFIALCQAVSYAHHQGIVHQDIKPDNVCLGRFGEVLLLDWGCAVRSTDGATARDHVYGTPLYMSPEQARCEPPAPACDIYCLGASFYHALTLCLPTWSDDPETFWAKKRAGVVDALPPDRAQGLPKELLGIARKALAAHPAERYPTADALRADLLNYQRGLAVSAHGESPWEHWRRWYRFHRQVFWTAAVALVVVATLTAAWLAEKAKERSSWRVTAIAAPGDPATSSSGTWSLATAHWGDARMTPQRLDDAAILERTVDGLVLKSGGGYTNLALDTGRLGDVRVEWDYTALDRPFDLNCFLGDDRMSGFTFHIGGFADSRKARVSWRDPDRQLGGRMLQDPLTVGVTHHFAMEHEDRHVRLRIDGETIFDILDPADRDSVRTTRFGFDTCERNRVRIAHVTVSHRPLAERISPLVVGDRLFEGGHDAEAETVYREVASSYPGTAIAEEATYRTAICSLRAGRTVEGLEQLRAFEAAAPASPLAPFALHERLAVAMRAGDEAATGALMTLLCAYREHPLLPLAFADLVDARRRALLVRRRPAYVGDPVYAADLPARIEAARDELLALARRIGRYDLPESFTEFAASLLSALDRNDLILAHGPLERDHYAQALVESGRFAEVLDGFHDQPAAYGAALLATRGPADLLDGAYGETLALTAAADAGRFVERYPRHRGDVAAGYMLVTAGLIAEALRDYPDNPGIRVTALLAAGRIDEAEAAAVDPYTRAEVLLARGRDDEVLATCFDDAETLYRIALRFLLAGEGVKGRQLVERLSTHFIDLSSTSMRWATPFLASFLERSAGHAGEAERLMDALLARHPTTGAQCLWYVAAYVTGRIDDAAFRKQPCRRQVEERLLFAQGLRHQWRHENDAAADCFRHVASLPWWKLDMGPHDQLFLQWCLKEVQH